jgi:hypothetical protein
VTDCARLSDRMLAVRAGGAWTEAEQAHLAGCPDCAAEWRLMQAGAALGAGARVDPARVAAAVRERLAAPVPLRPRRPWRRWAAGLAAAAVLALAVSLGLGLGRQGGPAAAAPDGAVMLTELEGLTAGELEDVLGALPVPPDAVMPTGAAGLSDLTDAELERVLRTWEDS